MFEILFSSLQILVYIPEVILLGFGVLVLSFQVLFSFFNFCF